LESYLLEANFFNKNINFNFITILGDYGSGKTTLMKRIFYEVSKMLIGGKVSFKPLLLELKNYHKFHDLELFLINHVSKNFGKEISAELLWKEINQGKFLFLLDGFDEMSPQINQKTRLKNFNILAKLFESPSITIITCRPSYFVSKNEYISYVNQLNLLSNTLLKSKKSHRPDVIENVDRINDLYSSLRKKYIQNSKTDSPKAFPTLIALNELSDSQIDNYLEKSNELFKTQCDSNWQEIKSFLQDIYDLSDLMSKPLLLSMIKDTILSKGKTFKQNSSVELGPAALYEVYTNLNLDYDWDKGETRHFLTTVQRREFAEIIAIGMFESNTLEIDYQNIEKIVINNSQIFEEFKKDFLNISIEEIAADIQICTFITRNEEDNFKFIHKSFMEFFMARYTKELITNFDENIYFQSRLFPKEILSFIGSFATYDIRFRRRLESIYNKIKNVKNRSIESSRNKRNILASLLYSISIHEMIIIKDLVLEELDFKKIKISYSKFENTTFDKNFWSKFEVEGCEFVKARIENSKFENGIFKDCKGLLEISGTSFVKVGLINSKSQKNDSIYVFRGTIIMSECKCENVVLKIERNIIFEVESTLVNTLIYSPNYLNIIDTTRPDYTTFVDCEIYNITIKFNFYLIVQDSKESTKVPFYNCSGFCFMEINYDKLKEKEKEKFLSYGFKFERVGIFTLNKLIIIDSSHFTYFIQNPTASRNRLSMVSRIFTNIYEKQLPYQLLTNSDPNSISSNSSKRKKR
jgi:NACHT domain